MTISLQTDNFTPLKQTAMLHFIASNWPYLAAFVIIFVSGFCFFIRSAQPKYFEQMRESEPPGEVEYSDQIKMLHTSKEPRINQTIPL